MTITRINPDTMHKNPAFSQAVIIESSAKLVYVGGQNAVNAKGEIVGQDIGTQTEQALKNVVAALEASGATLADVFKMTIYMVDGQSLEEGYKAASKFLTRDVPPPIVSMIKVAGLANPNYLIEIEAVAAIK